MSVVGMTNSINSQSLRKFLSKSRTCVQVVCVTKPVCPACVVTVCVWVSEMSAPELTGLRLTDFEPAACPQYQNKSSVSCFANPRLCLPCRGDCQVTFRKLSLSLSVCHAKASLLPFFPHPPPSSSFTAEKQVHCDSECSSTAQWLLFEMRFERVSMREKDREPQAASRLDE